MKYYLPTCSAGVDGVDVSLVCLLGSFTSMLLVSLTALDYDLL